MEQLIQQARDIEMRKTQAIEDEDYDTAKVLKAELDRVTRDLMQGNVSPIALSQENPLLSSLNQISSELDQVRMPVQRQNSDVREAMLNEMESSLRDNHPEHDTD